MLLCVSAFLSRLRLRLHNVCNVTKYIYIWIYINIPMQMSQNFTKFTFYDSVCMYALVALLLNLWIMSSCL
jgi:hypothetical protein